MPVLGAHLVREEHELLRADALGVDVDDDLRGRSPRAGRARSRRSRSPRCSAGVSTMPASASIAAARSRASRRSQRDRRAVVADSCSASSVRAWPIASSRPSSSSRFAADRVAHVLELEPVGVRRARCSIRSTLPSRRSSITGTLQCHGSSRKSEPSLPIASSSSRSAIAVPQSKIAITSPGKRSVPVKTQSVPGRAEPRLAVHALRLAAEQARAADVVTADVHQRAALDVGAQADVLLVVERVAERRADRAAARRSRRSSTSSFDALRLRVVAVHERLAQQQARALGGVEGRLDLAGWRESGFSHSTCLPASSALIDHSQCIVFGSEM